MISILRCSQLDPVLVIESHLETSPSLRIDSAFPALLDYALSLDLENMDVTDHGHIPYVVVLVRALEEWKKNASPFYLMLLSNFVSQPQSQLTAQWPSATGIHRKTIIQETNIRNET